MVSWPSAVNSNLVLSKKTTRGLVNYGQSAVLHMSVSERTLVLVKPEGVQCGKVGTVMQSFEAKGLKLVALKLVRGSEQLFREHYADIATLPFFDSQTRYMSSGPVVAMVWEGPSGAVAATRTLIGQVPGPAGSLRCAHAVDIPRNMVHGSDSPAAAQREIALWFTDHELVPWTQAIEPWLRE